LAYRPRHVSLQNDEWRKSRDTGGDDSDRKHLSGREVKWGIEANQGSRNEVRDRCPFASNAPARPVGVGGLRLDR
jgi:hypothetical protein